MTDKIWKMGQCVVAANHYNNEFSGCKFYVVRFLNPSNENNINYCIECAFLKETCNGSKLNNHCFLTKNDKIIDPMYHKYNVDFPDYLKFLATKIEVSPDKPLLIFDIQELDEEHRKNNRSQFLTQNPCFGFMLNTNTQSISVL